MVIFDDPIPSELWPGRIAYYRSPELKARGIRSVISVELYLRRVSP